jgi:hypothetical protein
MNAVFSVRVHCIVRTKSEKPIRFSNSKPSQFFSTRLVATILKAAPPISLLTTFFGEANYPKSFSNDEHFHNLYAQHSELLHDKGTQKPLQ